MLLLLAHRGTSQLMPAIDAIAFSKKPLKPNVALYLSCLCVQYQSLVLEQYDGSLYF